MPCKGSDWGYEGKKNAAQSWEQEGPGTPQKWQRKRRQAPEGSELANTSWTQAASKGKKGKGARW